MADRTPAPDTAELRKRWGAFAFTEENRVKADEAIARYPEGRQRSAVMPLLFIAQDQVGQEEGSAGWLPIPVIEYVAAYLDMPVIRALEVATFYFMYNLSPMAKYHVQVCGTTPCMLRGSDALFETCYKRGMRKYANSDDGLWTLTEVECMGSCATAPMVQINDENYEDLTPERLDVILDALERGEQPKPGTQEPGRRTSEPLGGPTTLKEMVDANHDYRDHW
jgi:NADH-quinone oxidoreductase subunit E